MEVPVAAKISSFFLVLSMFEGLMLACLYKGHQYERKLALTSLVVAV